MQLYVDLDGVLADFDRGYEQLTGVRPTRTNATAGLSQPDGEDVDWNQVRQQDHFYRDLPAMPDFPATWARISRYRPIVLTGIPYGVPTAEADKHEWVRRYLPGTLVICCASRDKAKQCRPGDVLIDDWEKYRLAWEEAGGVWVTFRGAVNLDRALTEIGL